MMYYNYYSETSSASKAGSDKEPIYSSTESTAQPLEVCATAPADAWPLCETLAREPRILDGFATVMRDSGLVGEDRAAKLLYLVLTSRLLDRPVSAVLKGPSSAGKSYLVETVLKVFPTSAYYPLTGMSERSLAYHEEPLKHRMLVIFEAAGLQGDYASYLLRSLLSEGCIRYDTVESIKDVGLRPKSIVREGPTGLLLTTTAGSLHPENETRLFSIPISDSPEQTAAIMQAQAEDDAKSVGLGSWLALQEWLEKKGEHRVVVPYGKALAAAIPPVSVRLRRDFSAMRSLIKTHAILHQSNRDRDIQNRIIANLDDYAAVRELISDLMAQGVEASVSLRLRETVEAVRDLCYGDAHKTVTAKQVQDRLGIRDKSQAWRYVRDALKKGYLINLEAKRNLPMRLQAGDPLPEELELLPHPDDPRLRGCGVDPEMTEKTGTCGLVAKRRRPACTEPNLKIIQFDDRRRPASKPHSSPARLAAVQAASVRRSPL